ncbi:MAG: biotin--[acetyl-CoA-carboxylase] ligase [Nostocoides sp.]
MRPALDMARIRAALQESSVTQVIGHERLASTNTEAVAIAQPWALVLAEHQVGGKGRLGRSWSEVPRAGLAMSILVPEPPRAVGWVPLLTGLALHRAVLETTSVVTSIKWPNDVLGPSGGKLAGILCERIAAGVVIGAGLNVDHTLSELPVEGASSLALELGTHAGLDRSALVIAYVQHVDRLLADLTAGGAAAEGVRTAYRKHCATIGASVQVSGAAVDHHGPLVALAVDDEGRLVLRDGSGRSFAVAAGDVRHVRMAE